MGTAIFEQSHHETTGWLDGPIQSHHKLFSPATSHEDLQRLRNTNKVDEKTDAQVLINARLVGGEAGLWDVLVREGRVEGLKRAGGRWEGYKVLDVRGMWVAPSMIDWHVHSKLAAMNDHRVDLRSYKSAAAVLARMRAALDEDSLETTELVGVNMRNGEWTDDHLMHRLELDARVSSTRPVALFFNGYHSMVMNTVALRSFGFEVEGHDGVLKEHEAWEPTRKLGLVEEKVMDRWIYQWAEKAATLGVTEVVDLEIDFNIRDWSRRCRDDGFNTLRVHVGIYEAHFADALSRGVRTGSPVPHSNGLIDVGPFKLVTDGGLGSQTAYCHDPYPGTQFDYGMFSYTPEKLQTVTREATAKGFKLAVHAIGDHANAVVLETLANNPVPPLPGSTIEHAQLLDFNDIKHFQDMNLIASVQPRHLADDRETCLKYWKGREGRAWALKTLADNGVEMKFGSDSPVADMNPWEAMAVAISRSGEGELPLSEEQAIDMRTAWKSSTSSGEMTLVKGQLADLIVIDRDPLACDARALRRTQVLGTMLGGRWTYYDQEALEK